MMRTIWVLVCALCVLWGTFHDVAAQQPVGNPPDQQAEANSKTRAKTAAKSSQAKQKQPKKKASKNTAAPKKGPGKPEQTKD